MSAELDDQYVFGGHVANEPADVGRGSAGLLGEPRSTSSTTAQTLSWMSEVSADDELSALCRNVADAMPPAARAAVVLVAPPRSAARAEGLRPAAVATSSPSTSAVMKIEWLLREGPARTSLESGETTVSDRLGDDGRWPRFARAVSAHDAVSAAAVPIPLEEGSGSGVLAAYSREEAAFDPRDLRVLTAFAGVIADVVARGPRDARGSDLEDLETARLVNQAVGVLITRHCDEEQALRRLRRISESTGQPLAVAARMIVSDAQVEAHLCFVGRPPRQRVQPLSES